MDIRDLVVTPLVVILVYIVAYAARRFACDKNDFRYFFPALTFRVVGAITLGFIYQFYYDGGDTFNYHTHGSRLIWNLFIESPMDGLQIIFLPSDWYPQSLQLWASNNILFYSDPASFFFVRVLALIDLFTFSTYSATAVVLAGLSFTGAWMMFVAFYRAYPVLLHWLAIPMFFIPSVFFWGSGILKDTPVLAAIGAMVYLMQSIFIFKRPTFGALLGLLLCAVLIFILKKYVLLCFFPAAILWVYFKQLISIRSLVLRILVVPLFAVTVAVSGYFAVLTIGQGDSRYSLKRLATTASITAYDIGFYSGRNAGSRYSIGELDGTFSAMLKVAPQAINVSLFRPYLWEVKNPLMMLAAMESLAVLVLTLVIVMRSPGQALRSFNDPYVLFCVVFSVTFAFAVGVSTFNFGTLARYKIPLLPFYVVGLLIMHNYMRTKRARASNSQRNFSPLSPVDS